MKEGGRDINRRNFLQSVAAFTASKAFGIGATLSASPLIAKLLSTRAESQELKSPGFFENLENAVTELEWRLSERGAWGQLLSGQRPGLTREKAQEIFGTIANVQHGLYAAEMLRTELEKDRARFPILARLDPKQLPANTQKIFTGESVNGKPRNWVCNTSYIEREANGAQQLFEVTARHCTDGSTAVHEYITEPGGTDIAVKPVETRIQRDKKKGDVYAGPPAIRLERTAGDNDLQGKMISFLGVNRHGKPEHFYGFAIKVSPTLMNILYPRLAGESARLERNISEGYVFFTKPGDGKILPDGTLPPQGLSGTMTWRWNYQTGSYIPSGPFFAAGSDTIRTSISDVISTGYLPGLDPLQRALDFAEAAMTPARPR